tara:strand:- start:488 stop:622 length:135 start_codon:yes stop_codon:yes gene_type:complete
VAEESKQVAEESKRVAEKNEPRMIIGKTAGRNAGGRSWRSNLEF